MWSKMNSDSCSDFAHGKDSDDGTQIGNRVAEDANGNIVLQTMAVVAGNEDKPAGVIMNNQRKNFSKIYRPS